MPMGTFPAGQGAAGYDPIYKPVPPSPVQPPRAVKFDPSVRQYVLTDSSGNPVDVHPVDQIVATRWTTERGSSGSVPGLGQRIRARFQFAPPSKHYQIAFQEISNVVDDLVANGDIIVLGVVLDRNASGAQVVIPTYVNLRTASANPAVAASSGQQGPVIAI